MGLCASTPDVSSENESENSSSKNSLVRKTVADAENVTEKAVEIMMKAKRRLVVHDQGTLDKNFVFPLIQKSNAEKTFLKNCLQEKFFLFKELGSESQSKMIDAMSKVESVQLRQVIMTQGDEGDFMYVIESGSYEYLWMDRKWQVCERAKFLEN